MVVVVVVVCKRVVIGVSMVCAGVSDNALQVGSIQVVALSNNGIQREL